MPFARSLPTIVRPRRHIEEAKKEEVLAVDALRVALADLAGAGTQVGPQPPPPEPPETVVPPIQDTTAASQQAKEHCEKARQLKAQRRYPEAAEEALAAIKADPNHVDAHWILAWVLVELKDNDGAATEFRKVIELAPGSKEAEQAEKALQRLGK